MIELVLPFPPTTNTIWRNVKGKTLLSQAAKHYRDDVYAAVLAQLKLPLPRIAGRVSIAVEVSAPDARRYDIDNRIKALLDALTHAAVLLDDEQVDRLSIERAPPCTTGFAKVLIEEIA